MNLRDFIFEHFKNVVVFDFEYRQLPGENPEPVCCTFKEIKSGKQFTHWYLSGSHDWPFENKETLYICHNAVAEVSCMLELGQKIPDFVWDTMVQDKKLFLEKKINLTYYTDQVDINFECYVSNICCNSNRSRIFLWCACRPSQIFSFL